MFPAFPTHRTRKSLRVILKLIDFFDLTWTKKRAGTVHWQASIFALVVFRFKYCHMVKHTLPGTRVHVYWNQVDVRPLCQSLSQCVVCGKTRWNFRDSQFYLIISSCTRRYRGYPGTVAATSSVDFLYPSWTAFGQK
eukprot:3650021-Rhodomonas_salina.1